MGMQFGPYAIIYGAVSMPWSIDSLIKCLLQCCTYINYLQCYCTNVFWVVGLKTFRGRETTLQFSYAHSMDTVQPLVLPNEQNRQPCHIRISLEIWHWWTPWKFRSYKWFCAHTIMNVDHQYRNGNKTRIANAPPKYRNWLVPMRHWSIHTLFAKMDRKQNHIEKLLVRSTCYKEKHKYNEHVLKDSTHSIS